MVLYTSAQNLVCPPTPAKSTKVFNVCDRAASLLNLPLKPKKEERKRSWNSRVLKPALKSQFITQCGKEIAMEWA